MSEANLKAYGDSIRQHLDESFPNPDSLPHTVNLITDDWANAISEKCPTPDGVKESEAIVTIMDTLYTWLDSKGHESVGSIYVNAERRDAAMKAEAEEQARKRAAEIAPLQALIKNSVMEVLAESGLLKPQPKKKPLIKGHRH